MDAQTGSFSSLSRTTSGSSQTTIGIGTVSGRAILALGEFAVRGIERFSHHQPLFALYEPLGSRSTVSLSRVATSDHSSSTGESSSTIHGPGHLSGKAIKALGTLTLDTIDEIWLRRRLAEIRVFFPHGRFITFTEDDGKIMYENILELSWPRVYSPVVRTTAITFIVAQIAAEEVAQLVRNIQGWALLDLLGFLRHLIQTIVYITEEARSVPARRNKVFPWSGLWDMINAQSSEGRGASNPFFKGFATLIFQLSLVNEGACQAARNVCPFLIESLGNPGSSHVEYLRVLVQSEWYPPHDIPLLKFEPRERRNIWKQFTRLPEPMLIRKQWIRQRRLHIDQLLNAPNIGHDQRYSICSDLVELCRPSSDHIDIGINGWALQWILMYIARSGEFWDVLIAVLAHGDDEDRTTLLNNALYHLFPDLFLQKSKTQLLTYFESACRHAGQPNSEQVEEPLVTFFRFLRKAVDNESLRHALDREPLQKVLTHYRIAVTSFTIKHPQFVATNLPREAQLCWEIFQLKLR